MEPETDWTDESILELVGDIREHRCIWDPMDTNHRRKRKKLDVYLFLSKKYNCSPEEVCRKWANLLQTFRNLRRKIHVKSSLCAEEYTPRWFAFKAINDFMKDVYTPRPPNDQGLPRHYSDSNSDILEDEESLDVKYVPPLTSEDFILGEEPYQALQTSENQQEDSSAPVQNNSAKRRRNDPLSSVPSVQLTANPPPLVNNDCYETFGTYVASMLRAIGPPEAFMLQQNITVMMTNKMFSMGNSMNRSE